jgi:hypothetical protein
MLPSTICLSLNLSSTISTQDVINKINIFNWWKKGWKNKWIETQVNCFSFK